MAEIQELTFPDLPVGQWWKLRNILKSNLPKSINIEYLMGTLKISESTAGNTFRNLGLLGLIDKDGKVLERTNNWRDDSLYKQVCGEIAEQVYPADLRDLAQASPDRNGLVSWFMRKTQIGEKASHKNAAIFEVIVSGEFPKAKENPDGKKNGQHKTPKVRPPKIAATMQVASSPKESMGQTAKFQVSDTVFNPSIHIDIQIHISPEAPSTQIEDIFTAIEKHIYKKQGS